VAFTTNQEEIREIRDVEMLDVPTSDTENEDVSNKESCDNTENISEIIDDLM
jgi:hypothetical protein